LSVARNNFRSQNSRCARAIDCLLVNRLILRPFLLRYQSPTVGRCAHTAYHSRSDSARPSIPRKLLSRHFLTKGERWPRGLNGDYSDVGTTFGHSMEILTSRQKCGFRSSRAAGSRATSRKRKRRCGSGSRKRKTLGQVDYDVRTAFP